MPAIDLAQALEILEKAITAPTTPNSEVRPILDATGFAAAESVTALVDHPPAAQSLRDGVAYAMPPTADIIERWSSQPFDFAPEHIRELVGEVFPGDPSPPPLLPGQAVRVMTGATLPEGTCGVAMIEDVEWLTCRDPQWPSANTGARWDAAHAASHVRLPIIRTSLHVLPKASIYARGDELVKQGTRLNPVHIGLLASTGRDLIRCVRQPRVAVLTTGDELAADSHSWRPGQIYNSNGPLLHALLGQVGLRDVTADHAGDSEPTIAAWLEQKLGSVDLILTTGAVSAGQKDQLPSLFQRFGVKTLFHGVHLKPGKPIYAGRFEAPATESGHGAKYNTMVLGLPGNPISVWVTFHLFGRPLLDRLSGRQPTPKWLRARLATSGSYQDTRLTFWPGQLDWELSPWDVDRRGPERTSKDSRPSQPYVRPLEWQGSPDLRSPTDANCLIYFPPAVPSTPVDALVDVLLLPNE